jgi:hypothetical protein
MWISVFFRGHFVNDEKRIALTFDLTSHPSETVYKYSVVPELFSNLECDMSRSGNGCENIEIKRI